ncbi:MAG: uracil-DNA glycosylase family protein [Psychroflexus halocasei]|uniref:uracil-DNA glycosylase family protein n=1 Tax=Psychroflexus sp. S27 TaxID=1982757 RepID=UPI000C298019|nr:uracil-DNA glycosylase family protein [Psychroflexus sp. S27]PJX26947.1 DUF4918 domain-containing protein [Psychroflexus sp. S27]
MKTFAENIINYYKQLQLEEDLGNDIQQINPYQNNPLIEKTVKKFYTKYFNDNRKRQLIIGINPGRLGVGVTGIPFTDTKRLEEDCGIKIPNIKSHEPSSIFVYQMIEKYGGAEKFYQDFYVNSVCPVGFIRKNKKENWVNCNYYDFDWLFEKLENFIVTQLKEQIAFGIDRSTCFVLGKKNAKYLERINAKEKLFDKIIVFNHPRYIVQYKSKQSDFFC